MDPNKALVNAVHAVANARLKAAAQNISRAANAATNGQIAQVQGEIENLKRTMAEAGQAARTAEVIAPNLSAAKPTVAAENSAMKGVNRLINNLNSGNARPFNKWTNAKNSYPNLPNEYDKLTPNQNARLRAAIAKSRAKPQNSLI